MPLIVDTYNVLHTTGVLPPDLAGLDVSGLCQLMAISRFRNHQALLICDGTGPRPGPDAERQKAVGPAPRTGRTVEPDKSGTRGMIVIYSGPRLDADTLIERLIARDSAPRRLVVVSSDRRIIDAARRRRCRSLPSEGFLRQLAYDFRRSSVSVRRPIQAQEVPLDRESVRWWLDYFGCDPDAARIVEVDELELPEIQPAPCGHPDDAAPDGSVAAEDTALDPPGAASSGPGAEAINETDSTRWWIRYFGFDPDRLVDDLDDS